MLLNHLAVILNMVFNKLLPKSFQEMPTANSEGRRLSRGNPLAMAPLYNGATVRATSIASSSWHQDTRSASIWIKEDLRWSIGRCRMFCYSTTILAQGSSKVKPTASVVAIDVSKAFYTPCPMLDRAHLNNSSLLTCFLWKLRPIPPFSARYDYCFIYLGSIFVL